MNIWTRNRNDRIYLNCKIVSCAKWIDIWYYPVYDEIIEEWIEVEYSTFINKTVDLIIKVFKSKLYNKYKIMIDLFSDRWK